MIRFAGFVFLLLFQISLYGQKEIKLRNPSFEDEPAAGKTPKGWVNCGVEGESEPDIQPKAMPGVNKRPAEGKTYLGMVTRDNDSWESVGQKLPKALKAGQCYSFSIQLSKSDYYLSRSRVSGNVANYNIPVRLLIWGGNDPCEKVELLASTELIPHAIWREYTFQFNPTGTYKFISFEAYFQANYILPYGGNLLLDDASFIQEGCTIDSVFTLDSPIETIQLYQPTNIEELRSFLLKEGPSVQFQADESTLEIDRYRLETSTNLLVQNKQLHQIVAAVKRIPDARLIIAVKGRFSSIEKQRKTNLEKAIRTLGGDSKQFEVQIFDPKEAKETWLWPPARKTLLMRLEAKN